VSLEFLDASAAVRTERYSPVARSPMERLARAAGARIEERDGWALAVGYASSEQEAQTVSRTAGWADMSHLAKLELQAEPDVVEAVFASHPSAHFELGTAHRADGAWWCPLAPSRVLLICEPSRFASARRQIEDAVGGARTPVSLVDVTTAFAALTIVGPLSREVFARFSALDLRPQETPVGAIRPGSVARQPGVVVHEDEDRFLMLFGWAVAEYVWRQVEEAARRLGGSPVGIDALAPLDAAVQEVRG
jgi:heterotetrameric sarcosine oxidase gamma subunit